MNSGCDHEAGACAGRELPGAPTWPGMAGMRVTTAGPVGAEPAICMGAEVRMVMGMLRLGLLLTGAADMGAAGGRCSPGLLGAGGGRPAASVGAWGAGAAACGAALPSCLMVAAGRAVVGAAVAGTAPMACGWGANVGANCIGNA
jgi:hypothetical protein